MLHWLEICHFGNILILFPLYYYLSVHNYDAIRSGPQERFFTHISDWAGSLLSVLHTMEWGGAGWLRGAAIIANVSLSAWTNQCVSKTNATAWLYNIASK